MVIYFSASVITTFQLNRFLKTITIGGRFYEMWKLIGTEINL